MMRSGVKMSQIKGANYCQLHHIEQRQCLEETSLTFLTIITLITSVADASTDNADAVSSTVDVDALVGWHVALGAFPAAVALAAATGVLAITTAQHWAGSWSKHTHRKTDQSDTLALQTQ